MTYYKTGDLVGLYCIQQTVTAYSCVDFKRSHHKKILKENEIVRATDIICYGRNYLLKLDSKLFITANKKFVKKL